MHDGMDTYLICWVLKIPAWGYEQSTQCLNLQESLVKTTKTNSINCCISPLGEKMTQNYRKWVKIVINGNKIKNYRHFDFLPK